MKYKIRNLVTNVFGWVTLILVVFFFFTMWLFNYNGVEQPLQSAWSLSASILSGLATLAAAYIAGQLYEDWRKPIFLSKIAMEQKEIISLTRRMKRNADTFLCFMKTNSQPPVSDLDDSNQFSLKYKKIVNDLLDDIDDLAGLLKAYEFNFKETNHQENLHLINLNERSKKLATLHSMLAKPSPVIEYSESYRSVQIKLELGNFHPLFEDILITLPDNLSRYYASLIKETVE